MVRRIIAALHLVGLSSVLLTAAQAQSMFVDARGRGTVQVDQGGYAALDIADNRVRLGYVYDPIVTIEGQLELAQKRSGEATARYGKVEKFDRLAFFDAALYTPMLKIVRALPAGALKESLTRQLLEIGALRTTGPATPDLLQAVQLVVDGVTDVEVRQKLQAQVDTFSRTFQELDKQPHATARLSTILVIDITTLVALTPNDMSVKPRLRDLKQGVADAVKGFVGALAGADSGTRPGIISGRLPAIITAAGELMTVVNANNDSIVAALQGQARADFTLAREDASAGIAQLNIAREYFDAILAEEDLANARDKFVSKPSRYGFEVSGKPDGNRTLLFENDEPTSGVLIAATYGKNYICTKYREAASRGIYDRLALKLTYGFESFTVYDGDRAIADQVFKERFRGGSITLNYNYVSGSNWIYGLETGYARTNNSGDLKSIEIETRTPTELPGGTPGEVVTKTKALSGDYEVKDAIPFDADIIYYPPQLRGGIGLDLIIRSNLRDLSESFVPGIGVFLTKKGQPLHVIGGLSVTFPKGKTDTALIAGFNF